MNEAVDSPGFRELIDLHLGIAGPGRPGTSIPIEAATQLGNLPILEFLIERGAPVDLFTACVLGNSCPAGQSWWRAGHGGVDEAAANGREVEGRQVADASVGGPVLGRSGEMVYLVAEARYRL